MVILHGNHNIKIVARILIFFAEQTSVDKTVKIAHIVT